MNACYLSFNNLPGLEVEAMQMDNGDDYVIGGEDIDLGSGGLTVAPAEGSVGPSGDEVETPLTLTSSQDWSIAGRGSLVNEAGLLLEGNVTGAGDALDIDLDKEPALYLYENDIETGPLSFSGANPAQAPIFNGVVLLLGDSLNATNGEPVELDHVFTAGTGFVGALKTTGAELAVGDPTGRIEASSATFDPSTHVEFVVAGKGTTSSVYSQIVSQGPVELGGAKFEVVVRPPKQGSPCPVLTRGSTYTFVSTEGQLSGEFSNAPVGGPELTMRFAEACTQEHRTIRLHYNESGGTKTVTGTIEEDAFRLEEEEAAAERKAEEEANKRRAEEEAAKHKAEEEAAAKAETEATLRQRAEEENARRKREEAATTLTSIGSIATSQEVAGSGTGHTGVVPNARLLTDTLSASPSGEIDIKVSCPAGETRCEGTVTLKSVGATKARLTAARSATSSTLGTGKFNIAGGKTATVVVHLTSRARLQLRHKKLLHARAAIFARDLAGITHTGTLAVTIHESRAKHSSR